MNDKDFEKLASTFGFAPSRALRELLDAATAQAALDERAACAKVCEYNWVYTATPTEMADYIRERSSGAAAPVGLPAGKSTGPVAAAPTR